MGPLALLIFIGLLGVAAFCWHLGRYQGQGLDVLRNRLSCYAEMKLPIGTSALPEGSKNGAICGYTRLTVDQHAILLGILKKVEAKNASLFRALTFIATVTIAVSGTSDILCLNSLTMGGFLFACIPLIFASLRGMRQLDQWDFRVLSRCTSNVTDRMQRDLCHDLLVKEACYGFAYRGSYLLIFAGLTTVAWWIMTAVPDTCSPGFSP